MPWIGFLNLGTKWRWVVGFMTRPLYSWRNITQFPLDRRLGRSQCQSGSCGEENISSSCLCQQSNPSRSIRRLVTILTELSRLILHVYRYLNISKLYTYTDCQIKYNPYFWWGSFGLPAGWCGSFYVRTDVSKTISVFILRVVELMWVWWTTQSSIFTCRVPVLRAAFSFPVGSELNWLDFFSKRRVSSSQLSSLPTGKIESGPQNWASTGINTGLGCPSYPHQIDDPERWSSKRRSVHKTNHTTRLAARKNVIRNKET
jgi:hypothetical protein